MFMKNASGYKPYSPILAAIVVLAPAAVMAQTQVGSSLLQTQFSLSSNNVIALGEPIVLRWVISNNSNAEKLAFLKPAGKGWITETLSDASGHTVAGSATYPQDQVPQGGINDASTIRISGHGKQTGYEVVSRQLAVPGPGKYTLSVHLRLPYGYQDGLPVPPESDPGVETEDFNFPLTVTQSDPARLQADSLSLEKSILQENDPVVKEMLIRSLFSLPEVQAATVWEQLAKAGVNVADALCQTHSIRAADILAEMRSNSGLSVEQAQAYSLSLAELYNTSTGALKQHIKDVYASQGISVGDTVHLPPHDN